MAENDELANKIVEESKNAKKELAERNRKLREVFSHIPKTDMIMNRILKIDKKYTPLIIEPNWNDFHFRYWAYGDNNQFWLVQVDTTTQEVPYSYTFWFQKSNSSEVKPSKRIREENPDLPIKEFFLVAGYRKNWFIIDNDYYELAHKKVEELFRPATDEPKKEKTKKAKEDMKKIFTPKIEEKKEEKIIEVNPIEPIGVFAEEPEDDKVIMGILEDEKVKILEKNQAIMKKEETQLPQLVLNMENIRNYIYRGKIPVTDQEIVMFLALCKKQNLDPFKRDVYLVKYSETQPAQMIVSKDLFLKRANECNAYMGMDAGIIVEDKDGKEIVREGSRVKKDETLVGGYCKIEIKDKRHSYAEVSLSEYYKERNNSWKNIPATMIRKVAIVQALREGFPDEFQGMYDDAEMIQAREEEN